MAASLFKVRKGLQLDNEVTITNGAGAPTGTPEQDAAGVGSLYMDITNGNFHHKELAGAGADRWRKSATSEDLQGAIDGISWREPVDVVDTAAADLATLKVDADTDDLIDGIAVYDGMRVLSTSIAETQNVYLVSGSTGAWTFTEEIANTLTSGDTVYVTGGTAAGYRFNYNGTSWVQIGAADEAELGYIRDFIGKLAGNELPAYTAQNFVLNDDDLLTAIDKLDQALAGVSIQNVNTAVTGVAATYLIDSVLTVDVGAIKYEVRVSKDGTNEFYAAEVFVSHDRTDVGTPGGAIATQVDFAEYAQLEVGTISDTCSFDLAISGAGDLQVAELNFVSDGGNYTVDVVRTEVRGVA